MAQLQIALQGALPEGLLRAVEPQSKDIRERYGPLFRGFEKYELHKDAADHIVDLEDCLHDLRACVQCIGAGCRASRANRGGNYYYGIHRRGVELYRTLAFAVHECPGVSERKEELHRLFVADREEPSGPSAKGQYPW